MTAMGELKAINSEACGYPGSDQPVDAANQAYFSSRSLIDQAKVSQ
jgi:hypothetical protein